MKTLAKRLRKMRDAVGISMMEVQAQTAKGKHHTVTQSYLSRLESGKEDNPSMAVILALAAVYGTSPNEIMGWEEGV